jgi:hypothetical protein
MKNHLVFRCESSNNEMKYFCNIEPFKSYLIFQMPEFERAFHQGQPMREGIANWSKNLEIFLTWPNVIKLFHL